jgi:DNA-binding CsgD family transcriptional regulator
MTATLSPAEHEVLSLVVEWCSKRTIAEELRLSVNIVRKHGKHAREARGTLQPEEVTAFAIRHRLAVGRNWRARV